ncbi:MAG: nitroreductase family protein [Firmicutes bacterium]|nr:nitroreductase family protein [Bacillota bacterium]
MIAGRRDIRKYKPDPVPREKLLRILEAARLAPSANNLCRSWSRLVTRTRRRRLGRANPWRNWWSGVRDN